MGGLPAASFALDTVDALDADELPALSARAQLDRVSRLLEARNRIDAELTRAVRAADLGQAPEDDGKKTMRSWLRGHGRLSAGTASRMVLAGLDALGGEKLAAALESLLQADRPKGDRRTRAQQLADALVQLCDNQLAAGGLPLLRTVKPHVVVTVSRADLLDVATGPSAGTTGFGGPLSAAGARAVACAGSITSIVVDEHGLPLTVGRTKRVVPPHLRRAVELRDQTCVFAGCAAPRHWCDVHHLVHWLHGGDTSLQNSALLCERHHTKVHHGFRVERDMGGRWRTFRPDGTEILIGTPLLV